MVPTIIRVICATPTLLSSQVHQKNNRKSVSSVGAVREPPRGYAPAPTEITDKKNRIK